MVSVDLLRFLWLKNHVVCIRPGALCWILSRAGFDRSSSWLISWCSMFGVVMLSSCDVSIHSLWARMWNVQHQHKWQHTDLH